MPMPTKCPRCEVTDFELAAVRVAGDPYKLHVVQCVSCGTAIGVAIPGKPVNQVLAELAAKVYDLEQAVRSRR